MYILHESSKKLGALSTLAFCSSCMTFRNFHNRHGSKLKKQTFSMKCDANTFVHCNGLYAQFEDHLDHKEEILELSCYIWTKSYCTCISSFFQFFCRFFKYAGETFASNSLSILSLLRMYIFIVILKNFPCLFFLHTTFFPVC
jgi:hypothetical protein